MDHMMAGLEDIIGKTGNYNVRDKFKRFDNRFLRPYLIRNYQASRTSLIFIIYVSNA
jgi:sodium/hydrogen exchanger-like protein 3